MQALIASPVPIEYVEFLPNEQLGLTPASRGGIYDLACRDANGRYFIVEMQLSEYSDFIQRMKFYSLYRFNTLAKKGHYVFEDLPRMYCIGILAFTLLPHIGAYHNLATLRNEQGELVDDQTTFVTVELPKFTTPLAAITTDLEKLLYTMKNLHNTSPDPIQWPEFWTEEWIQIAIDELDRRSLTPEQLLQYEMTLARNASIVHGENRRLAKAEAEGKAQGMAQGMAQGLEQGIAQAREAAIRRALQRGKLTPEEIAEDFGVGIEVVSAIQQALRGA